MSKLGKTRNNVGDLDVFLKVSSHAIILRYIVHLLLCITALVLGFSISREALLIVVSFRLPYGSVFVKTRTNANGHGVAIISFPRMKQTRALSRSDFTMTHIMNGPTEFRIPAATEVPLSSLGENAQVHAFSKTKLILQERLPSMYASKLESAPNSSGAHVGRHEILIRPWPHPDPSQVVAAQNLMTMLQEEQKYTNMSKERKPLLVVTPISTDPFHVTGLTCLMHSLRLVRGPLTWIVVEAGNASEDTATFLASSNLSVHHMNVPGVNGDTKIWMITQALRYIHGKHLEGIVVFAVEDMFYTVEFFHRVQMVNWMGSFTTGLPSSRSMKGTVTTHAHESSERRTKPTFRGTNTSEGYVPSDNICKKSLMNESCWYPLKNVAGPGDCSSFEGVNWSAFAFNTRLLWHDQNKLQAKSWRQVLAGNQSVLQSPTDLVNNSSQIEPLGICD